MIKFGTDGVRGIYGKNLLDIDAYKIGKAIKVINKNAKIVVGKDTRQSGDNLEKALLNGFNDNANAVIVNLAPTSCVSFIAKNLEFDYGVMITASHNPKEYNGIKLFNANGEKISDEEESLIEEICAKMEDESVAFKQEPNITKNEYVNGYAVYLNQLLKVNNQMNIVIDCANGASSKIAKMVFSCPLLNVVFINVNTDKNVINENCGATNTKQLQEKVKILNFDYGFAFDGDADRFVLVDKEGEVSGDKLMFLYAKYLKDMDMLNKNEIVGTIYTNSAVVENLKKHQIGFTQTGVGDKLVYNQLLGKGLSFGGENSGHYIFKKYLNTGDGMLSAIMFLNAISYYNKPLENLIDFNLKMQKIGSCLISDTNNDINNKIDKILKEYSANKDVKVVVRKSGTEPKIRIFVESGSEDLVNETYFNIFEQLKE